MPINWSDFQEVSPKDEAAINRYMDIKDALAAERERKSLEKVNANVESAVRDAEALLQQHYGEPVRPISEVCRGIQAWLGALSDNHPLLTDTNGPEHRNGLAWRNSWMSITTAAAKSNLLWRLLYARDPLRTEKCPTHNGHWGGFVWGDEEDAKCACVYVGQITGWLPND